eukprot:g33750.t1
MGDWAVAIAVLPSPPGCYIEECCTHQGKCGAFPCKDGTAQIASPDKLCANLQCFPEECCAPVDHFHRFIGHGDYFVFSSNFCQNLGCDHVHSLKECEYASDSLQLTDPTASEATSPDSPFGCYFRPNFQTLWFNPYGKAPAQESRNSICYCEFSTDVAAFAVNVSHLPGER